MRNSLTRYTTCQDKLILGEAYYKTIKEYGKTLPYIAIKMLVYLYSEVDDKVQPFAPYKLKRLIFDSSSMPRSLNILTEMGYIDRVKFGRYCFNSKGNAFIHGFWITHGNIVKRLTGNKG